MTHPAEGSETGDPVPEPDVRDLNRRARLDEAERVVNGPRCHDYVPTPNPEVPDAA